MTAAGTTWAGSHAYAAERLVQPRSLDELSEVVASTDRVRALGSRHSFTDVADTTGTLVGLESLPTSIEVDPERSVVRVTGGIRYGELATALEAQGWALANLASLPHISVAGAVATGTHGSGVGSAPSRPRCARSTSPRLTPGGDAVRSPRTARQPMRRRASAAMSSS